MVAPRNACVRGSSVGRVVHCKVASAGSRRLISSSSLASVVPTAASSSSSPRCCRRVSFRNASRGRVRCVRTVGMVNVDFGPGTVLGVALIGAGWALVQSRSIKPELSKDTDIFLSSIVMMSGGILVFQGWRLDPILLFAQVSLVLATTAFAIETFKLRETEYETQRAQRQRLAARRGRSFGTQAGALPTPNAVPADGWSRDEGEEFPYEEEEASPLQAEWRGREDDGMGSMRERGGGRGGGNFGFSDSEGGEGEEFWSRTSPGDEAEWAGEGFADGAGALTENDDFEDWE